MKRKIWKDVYFGMNLLYRDKASMLGLHVIKICFMKKKNVSNIIKKKLGARIYIFWDVQERELQLRQRDTIWFAS